MGVVDRGVAYLGLQSQHGQRLLCAVRFAGDEVVGTRMAQQFGLGLHVGDPVPVPGLQVVDDRRPQCEHQRQQRRAQDGDTQLGAERATVRDA
jgi:hypothetical protein